MRFNRQDALAVLRVEQTVDYWGILARRALCQNTGAPFPVFEDCPSVFSFECHRFQEGTSIPSTSETTTYSFRCRWCQAKSYGKYLYRDATQTVYDFRIIAIDHVVCPASAPVTP